MKRTDKPSRASCIFKDGDVTHSEPLQGEGDLANSGRIDTDDKLKTTTKTTTQNRTFSHADARSIVFMVLIGHGKMLLDRRRAGKSIGHVNALPNVVSQ